MMSSSKEIILGIDLGTTYSCAAYVENGFPRIIPSERGYTTMPSVVGLNKKGEIVVGHPAIDQLVTNPNDTIYGAKRLIGRKFSSRIVQEMKELVTYPIVEGFNGEAAVVLGTQRYELSHISGLILAEIRNYAQGQLGAEISRAVVTVPAYYNDNQRQAVKRAGEVAGFQIERIINEPTAAAIAYGYRRGVNETILIYDFGGGTFDVSVLKIRENEFEVLATGGDTFLGGFDVDNRLTGFALERFREATGKDLVGEKMAMQRLRLAAEQCKRDLSTQTSVDLLLPYITEIRDQPIDLRLKISREQLNRLSIDLVNRTLKMCDEVLASIGIKPADIDHILLVGGQTRMPLIRDKIAEHFQKPPRKGVHPEEVVALGAAILANPGASSTVMLKDVLSIPIGIALAGGKFKIILDRNTPIPASKSYKVTHNRNDMLVIDIFQGERPWVLENEYLGTFCFPAPTNKKGRDLEMRFDLSLECLLTVNIKDLATGETTNANMTTMQSPKSLESNPNEMDSAKLSSSSGWLHNITDRILRRTE